MSKVITERHLGEKLPFNISNSFIVSAFLDAMDGSNIISITDKDGTIEFVNDKFCDISGYSREELIGANHRLIRHQDMPRETFRKMWKTIKGGEVWRGVVKNRAKDGGEYIVDATIVPVHDSENNKLHYVSIRHDITGVIAQDKVIKKQIVDELTGIFNRTKLIDDLIKVHFSAVSIINIDGFSKINDFYGLHIGDDVLVLVSKMLQKQFKEPTICSID